MNTELANQRLAEASLIEVQILKNKLAMFYAEEIKRRGDKNLIRSFENTFGINEVVLSLTKK